VTLRSRRYAWYVLGLLAFVNLLNYANRNLVPAVYGDLRARYALSDDELGLLGSVFMFAHAAATLPMGWAGDRRDRRMVIAGGLLLASAATALAAFTQHLGSLAGMRALAGLGTAAVVPVANSILGERFAGDRKASSLAVFNLGLFLGGVVGLSLGGALGFPVAFWVLAAPGAIAALLVARLGVPEHRGGPPLAPDVRELIAGARLLLGRRTLRWLMGSTTCMAFASGGYLAWLLDFLEREKHLSKDAAVSLLVVAGVGGVAGILTGGRVADRLRQRRVHGRLIAIALGMSLTVPAALLCIYAEPGPLLYVGGVATLFFASWYHAPMAATVDDLAPAAQAATAQSLVIFTMHLVGTAPSSWVLGQVSMRADLTTAMLVATAMVALAALLIRAGFSSFASDAASARAGAAGGSPAASSL
jgi:MFS transporter, Spinster family, sphingosine-1-phosphate transporter